VDMHSLHLKQRACAEIQAALLQVSSPASIAVAIQNVKANRKDGRCVNRRQQMQKVVAMVNAELLKNEV